MTPTAQLDDEAATFCPLQESLGEGRSTSSSGLEQQPLFERHLWVLGHRGQGRAPGPHMNHWPDLSSPMVICFGCSFECLTSQAPSLQRRGTGAVEALIPKSCLRSPEAPAKRTCSPGCRENPVRHELVYLTACLGPRAFRP